jgi:hypothetical protein
MSGGLKDGTGRRIGERIQANSPLILLQANTFNSYVFYDIAHGICTDSPSFREALRFEYQTLLAHVTASISCLCDAYTAV